MNIGYSHDLKKTMAFYKGLPWMAMDIIPAILVFAEELTNQAEALERFKGFSTLSQKQIFDYVKSVNPDLIELKPGINFTLE